MKKSLLYLIHFSGVQKFYITRIVKTTLLITRPDIKNRKSEIFMKATLFFIYIKESKTGRNRIFYWDLTILLMHFSVR